MTHVQSAGRTLKRVEMLTLEKNSKDKPSSSCRTLESDLKKVLSDGEKMLNIFLYLAALENKGIKLSQDQKATILAKMKAEQAQFSAELQTYQTDSKNIGSGATTKNETTSNGLNTAGTVATIVGALSGIGVAAALCYAGVVTAPIGVILTAVAVALAVVVAVLLCVNAANGASGNPFTSNFWNGQDTSGNQTGGGYLDSTTTSVKVYDQGTFQKQVNKGNADQTKLDQIKQKMQEIETELDSQTQNNQSEQNMYNTFLSGFGKMGQYNNQRG